MRVHGGDSTRLEKGNLVVRNCYVTKFALYKRTYEAGLHFSGVSNLYEGNTIIDSPHNCILGGGNEADSSTTSAVDCVFRRNVLDTCSYEAADTGAFYVCGQAGAWCSSVKCENISFSHSVYFFSCSITLIILTKIAYITHNFIHITHSQ